MSRVLIVEDEEAIADIEKDYLELSGFEVTICKDGTSGLAEALDGEYDICILDVMLPGIDGFEICKKVRETKNIPIIMVSAKKEDIDKIRGLGVGADDYIAKPFNAMELVARVKSQLRRYQVYSKPIGVDNSIIQANDLLIDTNKKMVSVDNRPVAVTKIEYEILVLLASHPGTVFSTEDIYTKIWHEEATHANNTIMVHIRKLREKIERQPRTPRHIIPVWGIGYKFEL